MKKRILFPLAVLMCGGVDAKSRKHSYDPSASFDDMFQRMENHMTQMRKSFDALAEQTPQGDLALAMDEKDNQLIISISGFEAADKTFSANVNEDADVLTVKTDNASVMIHVRDKYVSVGITQRTQKEVEDKDEQGKKYKKMQTSSMSGSTMGRTVTHDVALLDPQPQINYDQQEKKLIIKLALLDAQKKGTSIPVNITAIPSQAVDEK